MVFKIPEEREFRLVVDGLYDEIANRTLPFSLEIDVEAFDDYSFPNNCAYFDYYVTFRVIGQMEYFLEMSYDNYDPSEGTWQFSYCNIFESEVESSDVIYDLFVQISWKEEWKEEENEEEENEEDQYVCITEVVVWVEYRDSNGYCGVFL